ncbi:hypothetical protein Mapa_004074 [Marchantia paleacea]|nr:hypothetical protein Mapa_004074 [Marchantia paleacea]
MSSMIELLCTQSIASFSLMMLPNFESARASVSPSQFAFKNFLSPLLSLLSTNAVAAPRASVVLANLLNAFSFTTFLAAS